MARRRGGGELGRRLAYEQARTLRSPLAAKRRRFRLRIGASAAGGQTTSTVLVSSLNPSDSGQSVTFTATVSAGTGVVTFFVDGDVAGTGAAPVATLVTSALIVGSHSVVAAYGGDASHAPSTSNTVTQVINAVVTGEQIIDDNGIGNIIDDFFIKDFEDDLGNFTLGGPGPETNFLDLSLKSTGSTKSRTFGSRMSVIVNVKDFGAVGDGVANDGAPIQLAFDEAFGPESNPHGQNSRYINKAVYIPAGNYKIEKQLMLNNVEGMYLFGAGQHQTRLFYAGPASNLPAGDVSFTAMIVARTVQYSVVRGITFDVLGSSANVGYALIAWPGRQNDGTGVGYFDCGFRGGLDAWLTGFEGAGALGSEQVFVHCTFEDSQWAARVIGGNALDVSFWGCTFKNCSTHGISCIVGAVNVVFGCNFSNNGRDIIIKQQQCPAIIGGYSTSANFCSVGPAWVAGVYHAGTGQFWQSNPAEGLDNKTGVIFEGNRSAGTVVGIAGSKIYLRANTFDNPNFDASFAGTKGENI